MAARNTGTDTKKEIIISAKTLFYQYGYDKTRYQDICNKVGISPGTLHYFFKKKKYIAGTIISDISMDLHKSITDYFKNSDDLRLIYIIEIIIYYKLLYENSSFQTFYLEICNANVLNKNTIKTTFSFVNNYYKTYNLDYDDKYIMPFAYISNHVQSAIITAFFEEDIDLTYQEAVDLCIVTQFTMYGENKEIILDTITQAREIEKDIAIKMSDDFQIIR